MSLVHVNRERHRDMLMSCEELETCGRAGVYLLSSRTKDMDVLHFSNLGHCLASMITVEQL